MIFSVRRPQYFISLTKSQRLLVTRHRLSTEKVTRNVSLGRLWILEGSFDGRTSSSTTVNDRPQLILPRNFPLCEIVFVLRQFKLSSLGLLSMPYLLNKMPSSMITIKTGQAYPQISLVKRRFEEMNVLVVAATSLKFKSVFLHAHNEQ